MAVVIGAQEDPGDPVQSLEACNTSSKPSNVPVPVNIVAYSGKILAVIWSRRG